MLFCRKIRCSRNYWVLTNTSPLVLYIISGNFRWSSNAICWWCDCKPRFLCHEWGPDADATDQLSAQIPLSNLWRQSQRPPLRHLLLRGVQELFQKVSFGLSGPALHLQVQWKLLGHGDGGRRCQTEGSSVPGMDGHYRKFYPLAFSSRG